MALKPYHLFGGMEPQGGMADYLGAHGSQDEADAWLAANLPAWWQLVVIQDDRLLVVREGETEKKTKKAEKAK